jgi:formate dehydrogenase maturation protein FdhE
MVVGSVKTTPWAAPRRRAEALRDQYAFADEVLGLYLALLTVWEESWAAARTDLGVPAPSADVAAWAAERVLPRVVAATAEAGPAPLVEQLCAMPTGDVAAAEQLLAAWMEGEELVAVERYLARATLRGPLEATKAAETEGTSTADGLRHCPSCGGLPQLSFRADTGDDLSNGARHLQCVRCGHSWPFSSSSCASCGESRGGRLTFYAEQRPGVQVVRGKGGDATFPHLRIEACGSCDRYLIDVDLGRDPRAVPEVDELAALPLDLYAAEQGLTKITPNLMGF